MRVWPAVLLLLPAPLRAAMLYVAPSPTGDDSHDGSEAAPLASMAKAQQLAKAGDTVFFRAGTYVFSKGTTSCSSGTATISGVVLDKDGAAGSPIRYFAYPGEVPVFDFDGIRDSCRIKGILVSGDYIHIKGLELRGVRQNNDLNHESWGLWNQGSHNTFEALNVHHIMGAGVFIQKGSDNLVLNCDSHHNLDEHTSNGAGESADGFGCHVGPGETGNVFRGCRAWWNADDGYDFISAEAPCLVEYSWAWYNGYKPDSMEGIGNGNGFKGGGYGIEPGGLPQAPAEHTVRFCLAFQNKAAGFYANHHPGPLQFYNNTSYDNNPGFNMLGITQAGANATVGVYRNNIAFGGALFSNRNNADEDSNSWSIAGVTVDEADFQSVASTGIDAPRQADGSLPVLPNFRLAEGSDLIDKGTDMNVPFAGSAPDLGAFELGLEPPVVVGGSAGAAAGGQATGGASQVAGAASGGFFGNDGGALGVAGASAPSGGSAGASAMNGTPHGAAGAAGSDAGCGCRAPQASGASSSGWGVVLLLLLARRRRG